MLTKADPMGKVVKQKKQSRKIQQRAPATANPENALHRVKTKSVLFYFF